MPEQLSTFLDSVITTDLSSLRPRVAPPPSRALIAWPWDIAKRGAEHLKEHLGAATALARSGQAITTSPAGTKILAAIASDPTSSANTGQVLNNGLFSDALNSVKADQLLRTIYIGWAGGAQVGIFGGDGGSGVANDVLSPSTQASVSYGVFNIGIGAKVSAGLLLGAMSRKPSELTDSTAVFQFGTSLAGVGAFVSVIMDSGNLDLIGFTLVIGVGGGLTSTTGYGSISAG